MAANKLITPPFKLEQRLRDLLEQAGTAADTLSTFAAYSASRLEEPEATNGFNVVQAMAEQIRALADQAEEACHG